MRIVDPFIAELDQENQTTERLLARVPDAKMSWKPHAKSLSLGQMAMHVATIPGAVATFLANDTFELGGVPRPEAKSAQELTAALQESVAAAKKYLAGVDDNKALATWKMTIGGNVVMEAPRMAMIRGLMLNHWIHHRGQLSVYLRLLDVPLPPFYGPTADENPFAR